MKKIIILLLMTFQFGCSSTYEQVNNSNLQNCDPITNNEDYINIDCKVKSVDDLVADVAWIDEPALATLQAESMLYSAIKICDNFSRGHVWLMQEDLQNMNNRLSELYDFENNVESQKDIYLAKRMLKGKYEDKINNEECENLKNAYDYNLKRKQEKDTREYI